VRSAVGPAPGDGPPRGPAAGARLSRSGTWQARGVPEVLTTLIVDYGGVLSSPVAESMLRWAGREGVDLEQLRELLTAWVQVSYDIDHPDDPIRRLERGELAQEGFEHLVGEHLGLPPESTAGLLTRMYACFGADELMNQVVLAARTAGIRTALLSNSWGDTYDRRGWDLMFDEVVISGEVGLRKPDPAIFHLTLDRLGVAAGECVFVDDLVHNIHAAVGVGMVGVHHTSADTSVEELEVLFARALRA